MVRRLIAAGFVGAVLAVGACRTPTQVTLDVTTNALCAEQAALGGDVLVDVGVAVGAALGKDSLASRGGDDHCEPRGAADARDNWVGDLVIVPGDAEGNTAEVVVVAGVSRPNTELAGDAQRADAERCLALLAAPGGIDGKACIVSRRIVGFVDNEKLTLPILLSTRCVGVDCGEDETCSNGTCVSARITCDAASGGCERPVGEGGGGQGGGGTGGGSVAECDAAACEAGCLQFAQEGECVDGACTCSGCVEAACDEQCGELGAGIGGLCVDGACGCSLDCDPDVCAGSCQPGRVGTCGADGCSCGGCVDAECDADCLDSGVGEGTGQCVQGDCICDVTCGPDTDCDPLCVDQGLEGRCLSFTQCGCACTAGSCDAHCVGEGASGGACDVEDNCVCSTCPSTCGDAPCNGTCVGNECECAACGGDDDCAALTCVDGQVPRCGSGGSCLCECDATACQMHCGGPALCFGGVCECGALSSGSNGETTTSVTPVEDAGAENSK